MMLARLGCCVAILLAMCAVSRADMGPIVPGTKLVHPIYRIITTESFPDHAFILNRYGIQFNQAKGVWDQFSESEYVELTPDHPIELNLLGWSEGPWRDGQRAKEDAYLLVVPRSLAASHPSAAELTKDAVALMGFSSREPVPNWYGDDITITYRIRKARKGDNLEAVRVGLDPLYQCCAISSLAALAVTLGGFWFIRRLLRRAPPAARPGKT
jgi:hypothetical protein